MIKKKYHNLRSLREKKKKKDKDMNECGKERAEVSNEPF